MNRNFFTTIVLAIALLAGNSPLLAAPSLTLTMGFGNSDVPPRKWKQDGQFVGLSLDIMQEVARRCQVTVEMKPYPWKRLLHYVQNGKIDGAFGVYRTPSNDNPKLTTCDYRIISLQV
jgi:polar amino acid transport system substrate-binding protein